MPPLQDPIARATRSVWCARPTIPPAVVPDLRLTVADLRDYADLVPSTVLELVRTIGADAAVALVRELPGCEFRVPRHPSARHWHWLAEIIGENAMQPLADAYGAGGVELEVPVCQQLKRAKQDAWVRNRFDDLTRSTAALSMREAVLVITQELARAGIPMTWRSIERAINRPSREAPNAKT